jgi:uncharacterized protein
VPNIHIDVITGFLESGKTSFIENILSDSRFKEYESMVLLVCEEGVQDYDREKLQKQGIQLLILEDSTELNNQLFLQIKKDMDPDYLLMEYNGTWDLSLLLDLTMPYDYYIRNIIFIGEAKSYFNYLNNMARILVPQIQNSDLVIVNRASDIDVKMKKMIKKNVHSINSKTEVIFQSDNYMENTTGKYFIPYNKYQKITPGIIITIMLLITLCLIPYSLLGSLYDFVWSISIAFLSILMQALPFLLLGSFVSALIQLLIPSGQIIKHFRSNSYKSFVFASIAGFFFPICDCGMVPVVSGLLKKDTPLPQTITFWLTSAAVNPIVILSVLYAYPGQPSIAFIRIGAGMTIGIMVGVILKIAKIETKEVIRKNSSLNRVEGGFPEIKADKSYSKLLLVLDVAKAEFFRVTRYVIAGAFLSSLLLNCIPQTFKNLIGSNLLLQLGIMILAAVFMSTCSTSNAFIARSFSTNFTVIPILSFMVLGPMLDLKNIIMLTEILKKSFLIKLSILVIVTGIFVFSIINLIW